VITGSHNWSSSAENANNENTLIIKSQRIANLYLQEFSSRYTEAGGADPLTSVEQASKAVPTHFNISQNYPNPFNPTTTIRYTIPSGMPHSAALLRVFDILGREVAVLVNEEKSAGTYQVDWNAAKMATGIYFYQLKAGTDIQTKSMILLK
jgi:hypothetical protein